MAVRTRAPRTYGIPKRSGGLRLMAELEAPDALRWASLARTGYEAIERSLGPEVLANRWLQGSPGAFIPSLRRARATSARLSDRADATLRTDVRAFYPSVDSRILDRSLAEAGVDRQDARECADLVEGWGGHGLGGLPVGPEPSALFANAVLAPVDAVLRRLRLPFLRWVDDYLIGLRGSDPGAVLEALDDALDAQGLRRHAQKTTLESAQAGPWLGGASLSRC